ncbi:MAG TPA: hypothetical protein VMV10_23185 [Pirellulales bacterium]|nr:hypothetical protein [Pirellulales bacterium]
MQLDKTRIAIRERSFPDILDLSLHVIRRHAAPLAVAFVAGAVPFAALNQWLLADFLQDFDIDNAPSGWYFYWLLVLIVWEAPLAAAPITLYLGQALFSEQPSAARLGKELWASLPQLIFFQVVIRALLSVFFLFWPVIYWGWPYLNEIILLERNPWRKRGLYGTSTATRSNNMHNRNRGELFSRWMGSLLIGAAIIAAIWAASWYLRLQLAYKLNFDQPMYTIYLPAALWLSLGYFAVVRFLSYLDLRIRTEGWEVELIMRAEGARLTRQLT